MSPNRLSRTDKSGRLFEIGTCGAEDFSFVLEMYRIFSPKPASQGLPPESPEACQSWIENLFKIGKNFLAWRKDCVIGHAAIIPDTNGKSGEFVVFVDQNHRNVGVGTELTRFTLEESGRVGFDSIWLTVNILNVTAVKLYKKIGFEYCDKDNHERMMAIKLRWNHSDRKGKIL
jgi:RimJ/RimL family protein N-acetyltransferase